MEEEVGWGEEGVGWGWGAVRGWFYLHSSFLNFLRFLLDTSSLSILLAAFFTATLLRRLRSEDVLF